MNEALSNIKTNLALEEGAALCLQHIFEKRAAERPDHVAIECAGQSMTYAELDHRANRMAWSLRARGVKPGSLVGLYDRKSCDLFAAMLGVLKAGAGYVPVDPMFPVDRIESIFADANVRAIVTSAEFAAGLKKSRAHLLLLDRHVDELEMRPSWPLPSAAGENHTGDLAYVIYTSGSTGRPKGVMIEHRNAVAFVHTLDSVYRITADDRIYQGFSIAFDASVEEIWAAFAQGGTLVVAPDDISRSPADAAEFITANGLTYFSTVPTFLSMMDAELPTVRLLVLGGEVCSPELVARWVKNGRRLLNTYGPTETTVVATYTDCRPGEPVTIGKPLPGYVAYVTDERLNRVAKGMPGELVIGGFGVSRGYLNRDELTAEKFVANPFIEDAAWAPRLYRTNDLARVTEDGSLQFLGRIDDQIKIRGFRVELSEIETALIEQPGVRAAAVRVVQSAGLPELAAYVVAEEGGFDRTRVADALRARLPDYMVPKFLDTVGEMPLLNSGKVDRKKLPEPLNLLRRSSRMIEPPANDLERTLHAVWRARFAGAEVSVNDDFFVDLGGHSMLAAQMITELRTKHGLTRSSVRDLYQHRTIRAFARHLQDIGGGTTTATEAADAAADKPTRAEQAFRSVPAWERYTTVAMQTVALLVYESILIAPVAFFVWMALSLSDRSMSWDAALWLATAVGFAIWPAMLLISIAVKWLVVGRFKPGAYPVWSLYYGRWWIANLYQSLSWSHMFEGSPLMSLYFRALGAKVGKRVTISTSICAIHDLVSIGDDASIGPETHITGYRVEDGMLKIGRIDIAHDCFVGLHCSLGLDTTMKAGARLDDMSRLDDGETIGGWDAYRGAPAVPAVVHVPRPDPRTRWRSIAMGFAHLGLIYAMGYFLILTGAPAIALVAYAVFGPNVYFGIAALIAAMPLTIVWYLACFVAVKKLFIGTIKPGRYPLHSGRYLRLWFYRYLLANTRQLMMPVYSTVYLATIYRWLGAKIGKNAELSTLNQAIPELLEIGEGSFLADECMVGGIRIHNGVAEVKDTVIGSRSFIGNSAYVRGGAVVDDDVLVGVMSTPPADSDIVPEHSQWLGSPGFALPRPEAEKVFDDTKTFAPDRRALRLRAVSDTVRILLPSYIAIAGLGVIMAVAALGYDLLPWWAVALALPLVTNFVAVGTVLTVAAIKRVVMGTFKPEVHPLYSPFVWFNDVINGIFEAVAAVAMTPFMGTPYLAPLLRTMGCKVGKWCFLDTTLVSEFDLVRIGDYASLNLGATLQTHLFEDRVMKSDTLVIGDGCNVGNMAIVLYATEMQRGSTLGSLSVLMKGETLPPMSRWRGIPSEPYGPRPVPTVSRPDPQPPEARANLSAAQ